MRVIFVRHALSNSNRLGRIEGHRDSRLSDKGKMQARAVGLKLKGVKIDAIYSSDLRRARETAREIARYHRNVHIIFTRQLRERKWGLYEGKSLPEKELRRWRSERDIPDFRHRGGETLNDAYDRIKKFAEGVKRKNKGTVVVVSHGYVGRILVAILTGRSAKGVKDLPGLSNASISILESSGGKRHKVRMMNDVDHLAYKS
jgi:broad specificity phosphatase PhoE